MLKRPSLFERCVTLPVGTWWVARKQWFRCVGGHVHNLTTSYFEQKKTKFVCNNTKSLFCLSSLCQNRSSLCLFFVYPTYYIRKSQPEHAFDARGSAKPEPQQRRQWEGASVGQKNPSPQTLRSPKIHERLVVTTRSTARSCRSMSSYRRVLAASSRVLAARSEPVYCFRSNLCRFRSKFAWALPLNLSLPWTMNFFSETTNTDKKWELVPNAQLPRQIHRTWSMRRDAQPNQREKQTFSVVGLQLTVQLPCVNVFSRLARPLPHQRTLFNWGDANSQ